MAVSYKQAAKRQYADALTLQRSQRFGTADHLFGLAAECSLKAILHDWGVFTLKAGKPDPDRFGKHMDATGAVVLIWEYNLHPNGRTLPQCPTGLFSQWRVEHRYEEDASFSEGRVETHQKDAEVVMELLQEAEISGVVR